MFLQLGFDPDELWPFLLALVIAMLVIALFPAITLWLPGLWVEQGVSLSVSHGLRPLA